MCWCSTNSISFRNSRIHHSSYTKITKFTNTRLSQENIGVLKISVNDISIMQVFNCQTYLRKLSQYFFFTHATELFGRDTLVLLFLNETWKIFTICEVHDDTKFLFCSNVYFSKFDNIWMIEYFMNFGFFLSLLLFWLTHATHIDVLNDN